tara:strand:+ start:638 stop:1486 length:849 start_codon:yes stop_codon:yes gene_type:complete
MIIWISSYPKSGNTWLRSLISNYFFSKNGDFDFKLIKQIDSFPSSKFFRRYKDNFKNPEDTSKYWIKEQEKINSLNKVFFFKTHNALCKINGNKFTDQKNTLAAIYIVRDPRNVITSISNHYQISKSDALNFMKDKNRGIIEKEANRFTGFQPLLSWDLHVKSWTENKLYPTLIIRYEDLILNASLSFEKVINFIKKVTNSKDEIDKVKFKKCLDNCKFSNLKKMEKENGFDESMINKKTGKKIVFFNLGEKNNYKEMLEENLINEINGVFGNELKKFKYIN